jgi:protein gp37
LQDVFKIMQETPWHIYQILTKRSQRLAELAPSLEWSENIWMGVSVESQKYTNRIDDLRQVPANVRFLSCEPLLGALCLDLSGIDWVIVGGESGVNHRPIQAEWVREILQQTRDNQVAFFFKQWGGKNSKAGGRILDEQIWEEMPEAWTSHLLKWKHKFSGKQTWQDLEHKYLISTKI